jgi:hypothetical protein
MSLAQDAVKRKLDGFNRSTSFASSLAMLVSMPRRREEGKGERSAGLAWARLGLLDRRQGT